MTTALKTGQQFRNVWDVLGHEDTDFSNVKSMASALASTGLDAPVTIESLDAVTIQTPAGPRSVAFTDQFTTQRVYPDGVVLPLGVVGKRYHVVQDSEAFAFADTILDGAGTLVNLGDYDHGRQTFAAFQIGDDILINGQDAVGRFAVVRNSHDGSCKISYHVAMTRFACANQITPSLKSTESKYYVKHTASAQSRVEDARNALAITFAYTKVWQDEMERLAATEMSNSQVDQFLTTLFPAPKDDAPERSKTLWTNKINTVWDIYDNAPTQQSIKGNAYAAFNSVVEYLDHHTTARGGDALVRRAERALSGEYQTVKDAAFRLLLPV